MTFATSLALRWQRAQQIDPASIEPLGPGWYVVPSSRDPHGYAVHIDFDPDGELVAASCTCLDFGKRTAGMGTPLLHPARLQAHPGRLPPHVCRTCRLA